MKHYLDSAARALALAHVAIAGGMYSEARVLMMLVDMDIKKYRATVEAK